MLTIAERALQPLDWVRGSLLRSLVRLPLLRDWLTVRDRRIALVAAVGIGLSFLLTLVVPAALYAIGPIVLGVPHVASDVRYLVVRRGLPRWLSVAVLGGCGSLFAVRLLELYAPGDLWPARLELGIAGTGALGLVAFAALQNKSARRRGVVAASLLAGGFGVALAWPHQARLVLAHLHNLVAVAIWIALFRSSRRALWLPLGCLLLASGLLLSGATFSTLVSFGGHEFLGQNLLEVADWLAPGLGVLGVNLTIAYVFWQSIHYSVWLGWIPQEETRGQGSLTFRQSLRSLLGDFGPAGFWFVASGVVTLVVLATFSLHRTRDVYLFLAGFHAYLEIAMLGFLLVRRD